MNPILGILTIGILWSRRVAVLGVKMIRGARKERERESKRTEKKIGQMKWGQQSGQAPGYQAERANFKKGRGKEGNTAVNKKCPAFVATVGPKRKKMSWN
jgi:hypothetical protein